MKESTYRGKIRGQGRITIPKSIREALGVVEGDSVDIIVRVVKDREEE